MHHPGPRTRSHSTSHGSTHLCSHHNPEENHHHHPRNKPDHRHISHSFHPNSHQVYHGPPSPHLAQGGHMPSNIDPRLRQSSQLVAHSASYHASAHLPNLAQVIQYHYQSSSFIKNSDGLNEPYQKSLSKA